MKAVAMTSVGGPEVLELREMPAPVIQKEREILVRLKACGVNPVDTKLRSKGTYFPERMPSILGCDGAGIVQEIGSNVRNFKTGDEVYFCNGGFGGHPGNYAQFAVVDERFAAHKPKSLSFVEAAGAPLVLITAWESLFDRCNLEKGQSVLIHAGAGGVGHCAVQLANIKGAKVCTTVSSKDKAEFVRKLGCEKVIFYKEYDFVREILDWSDGDGVDIAFDTVGGETFYKTFSSVRMYGDLVTILQPVPEYADWKEARMRNLSISYELMLTPMIYGLVKEQMHQAEILEKCARLIDEDKLKIYVGKTFPLKAASDAHQMLEKGSLTGKIVLIIDD